MTTRLILVSLVLLAVLPFRMAKAQDHSLLFHLALQSGGQHHSSIQHQFSHIRFQPELFKQIELGVRIRSYALFIGRGTQNVEVSERLNHQINGGFLEASNSDNRYFTSVRLNFTNLMSFKKVEFQPFIGARSFDQGKQTIYTVGYMQSGDTTILTVANTYHGRHVRYQAGIEVLKQHAKQFYFSFIMGVEYASGTLYEHRLTGNIGSESYNLLLKSTPFSYFWGIRLTI